MKKHPLDLFLFPLVFLFGLIVSDPSFAQSKKKAIEDTPKGSIVIVSQSLEFDNEKKVVIFSGDVNAKKDDFVIDCQKMVVFYQSDPQKKNTENPDTQIEKLIATGRVKINRNEEGTASAEKAEYYPKEEKIVLSGKPTVKQGNNVIEGDVITIFLEENRSIVESSKDKKVRAIIFPKDEKKERL